MHMLRAVVNTISLCTSPRCRMSRATHCGAFCKGVCIFRRRKGLHRHVRVTISSIAAALEAGALLAALGVAQVLLPLDLPGQDHPALAALSPGASPRFRRL